MTTDLEMSRKIAPYMGGVETEKVWSRSKKKRVPDAKFGMWIPANSLKHMKFRDYIVETAPAYNTDELRKRFGNLLTVKARKRTGNEVVFLTIMNGGRRGKGSVGLMSFEGHAYSWYKQIPVEDNVPQALAELLLWCGEQGHLEVRDEG
jgi:hypothetical protein